MAYLTNFIGISTLLILTTYKTTFCFPTGAPEFICGSMVPGHPATTTSGTPPYTLNIRGAVEGGKTVVHGTLASNDNSTFRGFLIEKIPADGSYGSITGRDDISKTVCETNTTSGLTHINNTDKSQIDFTWTPTSSSAGNIQFRATVVEDCCKQSRFWLNITSNRLTLASTVSPSVSSMTPSKAPTGEITFDTDCGLSKGCFSDCDSSGCSYLVTWQATNNNNILETDNETRTVLFDIKKKLAATNNKWIAVGISPTGGMDGTNVAACLSQPSGVTLQSSHNVGYSNVPFDDPMLGLSLITGDVTDGIVHCQFTRDVQLSNNTDYLDLENLYYILVGSGPISNGTIQQHDTDPVASPDQIDFMKTSIEPATTVGPPTPSNPSSVSPTAPAGGIFFDPDCGVSKGCFSDCDSSGCTYLVTWQANNNNISMEADNETGTVLFDIKKKLADTNNKWIAIGISPTGGMDGTNVAACLSQPSGVTLLSSHNVGYSNVPFDDSLLGLALIAGDVTDGIVHCQFTRDVQLPNNTDYLDLENMYYMLVGSGPVSDGTIQQHDTDPVASPDRINFMKTDVEPATTVGPPSPSSPTSASPTAPAGGIVFDPDCGVSKGCFSDCDSSGCTYLVTWQANNNNNVSMEADNETGIVLFDIKKKLPDTNNKWIAIGISPTGGMDGTNVAACLSQPSGVTLQSSHNVGYSNVPFDDPMLGLSLITGDVTDGIVHCQFTRDIQLPNNTDYLDLENMYYMLVGSGPVSNRTIQKHGTDPVASPDKIDFLKTSIEPATTVGPPTPSNPSSVSPTAPAGGIVFDPECGISKGCFSDCESSGCSYLVTWQANNNNQSIETENEAGTVLFDIKKKLADTNNKWIAVGISPTGKMDGTNVAACLSQPSGVTLQSSYNDGYSNIPFKDPLLGLSLITGDVTDGIIHCQFTRDIQLSNNTKFLDLEETYFMLVGSGTVLNGVIQKHDTDPVASPDKIDFRKTSIEPASTTGTPPVTNPLSTSPTPSGQIVYDPSCGVSKGCFPDCLNKQCTYLVTWYKNNQKRVHRGVTDDLDVDEVIFDLKMKVGDTNNKWIAVGISPKGSMRGTNVAACLSQSSGMSLQSSYNEDASNVLYNNPLLGLKLLQSDVSNGIIHCQFSRMDKLSSNNNYLDLNKTYYLVVGTGPVSNGVIGQHTQNPYKSQSRVNFMENYVSKEDNSGPSTLVKLHASLMVIAWVFLSSVGIVAARHCKTILAEKLYFRVKAWFLVHRGVMMLAAVCVIVAFVVIFVEVKGFSKIAAEAGKEYTKAHPYTGIATTVLALTNPILAFFRPSATAQNRPMFNWVHFTVGNVAHLTAIITVFFGIELSSAKVHESARYVIAAYCVVYVLIHFILETYRRNQSDTGKAPPKTPVQRFNDVESSDDRSFEMDESKKEKSMKAYGSLHRTNSSSELISDVESKQNNFAFYTLVVHSFLMLVLAVFLVLIICLPQQMKNLFDH